MAYIGRRPDEVFRAQATHDTFTGDGSTVAFDLSFEAPDNDADLQVFVDNVRQEPGASKSYTIGADGSGDIKRITFNVAPDSSAEIYVINPGRDTSLIDVADAAVTTAKIASTAVTTAKIGADAITGAKLADDAVDSEHLVDGSVDNVHLSGSIANSKLANSSITINGTAVALGGSVTAGTDWQAVVVADGSTQLSAVAGRGYFLDTNNGVIEVTLPSSPSRGDTFIFADYGNNFATNRVVIDTAGKLIDSTTGGVGGADRDFVLETNGQVVELVFVDDTSGYLVKQNNAPSDLDADSYTKFIEATGGTVTTSGDFKIHTFTGDGCFVVSQAGSGGNNLGTVSYVVVAGGGEGGSAAPSNGGGGGGAGGYREGKATYDTYTASPLATTGLLVPATTYPITVGGGASQSPNAANDMGAAGSNSVFSTITSAGGGGGKYDGSANPAAQSGGSGGGGSAAGSPTGPVRNPGGSGNTPPVSPPQGNPGGTGGPNASGAYGGGGGGGAGGAGDNNSNPANQAGDGGAGVSSEINGSAVTRAGGGGASSTASPAGSGGRGAGGPGGGGQGGFAPNGDGANGTANTGGGGGGGGYPAPGSSRGGGGKGIVIIRYKFQ